MTKRLQMAERDRMLATAASLLSGVRDVCNENQEVDEDTLEAIEDFLEEMDAEFPDWAREN